MSVLPSPCLCSWCTSYLEGPPLFVLRSKLIYVVVPFKSVHYIYFCYYFICSTFWTHFQCHFLHEICYPLNLRTTSFWNLQNTSFSFCLEDYFKYQSGMQGNFKGDMVPILISLLCLITRCTFIINTLILNSDSKTCHLSLSPSTQSLD